MTPRPFSRPFQSALLAATLCPLAMSAVAAQSLAPPAAARVDSVFARFTGSTPGCALDVLRGGKPAYARGYGLASLELGVPISPRTVFDIGSTSKQFTAATVALLALDGKLSLDDDVRRYLPELPDLGSKVTIRHLLSHTSGWRDYIDIMSLAGWDDRDHTTDRDALDALVRQRALNFAPGSEFRYSNTGFFLASLIVKRVTGKSLADVASERIFRPLGMTDTRYLTDAREVIPNKATAYDPFGPGKWLIGMSNWEQIGDGGVQTTVEDLAKWDANFTSGAVGGRPMLDLLLTPTRLNDGTALTYGLGLFVDRYHDIARVQHGGAWAGYRAMLMRFPSEQLSILLACNVGDANTMALANGVADVLLPARPVAAGGLRATTYRVDSSLAGVFYDPGVGGLARLQVRGDSLVLLNGQRRVTLEPLGDGRFRDPMFGAEWRFAQDASGARWSLSVDGARPTVFTRVEAARSPARLQEYAGTYASAEAGAEWTIAVRDSSLIAQPRRGDEIPLRPIFRDAFGGAGTMRFQRDAAGRVVALTLTTRGVQALRFERR